MKLWGYDDGMCYYNGVGHSGHINKVNFKLRLLLVPIKNLLLVSAPKEQFSYGKLLKKYLEFMLKVLLKSKLRINRRARKKKLHKSPKYPKNQKLDIIKNI